MGKRRGGKEGEREMEGEGKGTQGSETREAASMGAQGKPL